MRTIKQYWMVWLALIATIFLLFVLTPWVYGSWDKSKPSDTRDLDLWDDDLRANQDALEDALGAEHTFTGTSGSTQTGIHKEGSARIYTQATAPTASPDGTSLVDADDEGRVWVDTDTGVLSYYSGGGWLVVDTNLADVNVADYIDANEVTDVEIRLTNDGWMHGRNQADDGDVNLLKIDTNDVLVLMKDAELEDNEIATTNEGIVTKGAFVSATVSGATNISNTTADWADMTTMSVTVTTNGSNLLVLFTATFESSADGSDDAVLGLRFDLDGSPYCTQQHWLHNGAYLSEAGQDSIITMHWLFTSLAAGSHTIKVQWKDVVHTVYQDGTEFPRVLTVTGLP